jgi:hypothetical protein
MIVNGRFVLMRTSLIDSFFVHVGPFYTPQGPKRPVRIAGLTGQGKRILMLKFLAVLTQSDGGDLE